MKVGDFFSNMLGDKQDTEGSSEEGGASAPRLDQGLASFFTADHHQCDGYWADVETAIESGQDDAVEDTWKIFHDAMERHLKMEESVLFPAFEEATGMTQGPTAMMRMEHDQMRSVMAAMGERVAAFDHPKVESLGDTLMMLIQQHNMKEQGMLYRMAEQVLSHRWEELSEKLEPLMRRT